ncbi:hypothetical protein COCOBI_13-2840 [Coccomyxa sp. Obi]|nr:hypothetical protein COCOBI_13-2840 [Coccomyxa sp. Obi]
MGSPSPKLGRCVDVSCVGKASFLGHMIFVDASDPVPFEGMAEGDDDASFLPNVYDYRSAGRQQAPAPVRSLPKDRKVPSFGDSEATGDMDFGTALHAMLNLWGEQGGMEFGAAERTETPITEEGLDGVVFTYLPSHLEAAKRMSIDEKLDTLKYLKEKNRKQHDFIQGVGGILADCLQKLGEAY